MCYFPLEIGLTVFERPRGSFNIVGFNIWAHTHLPGNQLTTREIVPTVPRDANRAALSLRSGLTRNCSQSIVTCNVQMKTLLPSRIIDMDVFTAWYPRYVYSYYVMFSGGVKDDEGEQSGIWRWSSALLMMPRQISSFQYWSPIPWLAFLRLYEYPAEVEWTITVFSCVLLLWKTRWEIKPHEKQIRMGSWYSRVQGR